MYRVCQSEGRLAGDSDRNVVWLEHEYGYVRMNMEIWIYMDVYMDVWMYAHVYM